MDVTYVTALYNINREHDGDGRKWADYLQWFRITLLHNAPMIIFIPSELYNFVKNNRSQHLPTKIIIQELHHIPYYKYKDDINNVIKSPLYKQKMGDTKRIECYLDLYTVIQYSKFEWLKLAQNPFNSKYIFWIDGGLGRFYHHPFITKPITMDLLKIPDDRFVVQATPRFFEPITDDYIWDNNSKLYGGVFGGHVSIISKMSYEIRTFFEHHLYNLKVVNNEQILLLCLYKIKPHLFFFLTKIQHIHPYTTIPHLLHGEYVPHEVLK